MTLCQELLIPPPSELLIERRCDQEVRAELRRTKREEVDGTSETGAMSPKEADDDGDKLQVVQASVGLPKTSLRVKTADEE